MRRKNSLRNSGLKLRAGKIRTAGRSLGSVIARGGWISALVLACGHHPSASPSEVHPATRALGRSEPRESTELAHTVTQAPETSAHTASGQAEGSVGPPPTKRDKVTPTPVVPVSAERLSSGAVSHLTAGKRRGAALVTEANGTSQLHVFALDPQSNAGHPAVPFTRPTPFTRGHSETLGLYTGRDDWPRVITADNQHGDHYFRFRPSPGWEKPRDEQGSLANAGVAAGYYGVLGHDDPEVLCAQNAFCYEKRQSGWQKRALPGAGIWTVHLLPNGEVWAWSNSTPLSLCRLQESWDCTLPHPGVPLVSLARFKGNHVALTNTGLMLFDKQWTLVAPLSEGRALRSLNGDRVLVLTTDGLWLWNAELRPVQSTEVELTGGCCLEPGPDKSVILGGEHGVWRLTFE